MRTINKLLRGVLSVRFIILTLIMFVAMDMVFAAWAPVENSLYFTKNDFEKTILSNDGAIVYKKVFFGNSTLISSYIEENSASGYVNFGLDYGTVCDLYEMLSGGYLKVTEELALCLNYFVLMDTLETNPTYPWHRGAFEPYVFFQRDRLAPVLKEMAKKVMSLDSPLSVARYSDLEKTVYHGVMTDEELDEKKETHSKLFWGLGVESYRKNLEALRKLCRWCKENDVRLRALWGPWNGAVSMPENPAAVMSLANRILDENGVETLDMTDSLERKYFYDIGHLNYEYGAVYFTEVLEQWLLS